MFNFLFNKKSKHKQDEQIDPLIITHYDPRSPIAEAYRTLRTNVNFVDIKNPLKTIMITSSIPNEGKTITAVNLAITMANQGMKTLIVDCDLRRPSIHACFGVSRLAGISDILLNNDDVLDVCRKTMVENLYMLPSGFLPPNPSEILGSQKMKDIINKLKLSYDKVIFDMPAVLVVTDAALLASEMDGVILVIMAGKLGRETVIRAKNVIESVRGRLVGVVLNKVDIKRKSYYYYYGYESRYDPIEKY